MLNNAETLNKIILKKVHQFGNMEIISDLEKNSLEEKEKGDKTSLQEN